MTLQLIVFVLGAVGALSVALMFESSCWKYWWIAGFGVLSLVGLVLTIVSYEKPVTAADVAREIAGASEFCFLEPVIANPKDVVAEQPIRIVNNGPGPIPKLQFHISPYWIAGNDKRPEYYYSIMPRSLPIECSVGKYWLDAAGKRLTLPRGRYRVEFTTSLGTGWHQILTIEQSFDELVSVSNVYLPNRPPYRTPRPANYRDW